MNAFREPRSLKRRSSAMMVDEKKKDVMEKLERLDHDSPIKRESSHKKRRVVSRLTSTEHGYDPRTSPTLRAQPSLKFSPLRLGYLPPPIINFDGSSSESESDEEEVKPIKNAKMDGSRSSEPRKFAVARRLQFGHSPGDWSIKEKKGENARRNSLPVLPRARDLAELFKNL